MAKANAAKRRISWLSYDITSQMTFGRRGDGSADAAIQSIASQLATVPGEVWVALAHEPEGDGNLTDWTAMQRRLLPPLQAVANVRTSIITTGFDTWFSGNPSYSMDALWPGSMCDIMGTDRYNPPTGFVEMKVTYDKIAADAKASRPSRLGHRGDRLHRPAGRAGPGLADAGVRRHGQPPGQPGSR
jgi:hypothetical protein